MGVSIVSPEDQTGGSGSGLTDAELRASPLALPTGAATEATLAAISGKLPSLFEGAVPVADGFSGSILQRILQMLLAPLGYDKSLQRYRGTAIIESGTITTVTTLTNQTNIGGFNADAAVRAQINTAWNLNVRARIT